MARPLPATAPREVGKPADSSSSKNGTALRSMLTTAEFWKEETSAELEMADADTATPGSAAGGEAENDLLRQENAELRAMLEDLQRRYDEAGSSSEPGWEERQREYEGLLEEKSEVIRSLHQKIQELQARPAAPALTPREDELIALSDELERERCQLEQDRRDQEEERAQLKEDEKIMMQQMKEMEVQMARDRAELARQRNELQRLHNEVHHELELASRDAVLRERLLPLQRRHQEMNHRPGTEPTRDQPAYSPQAAPPPKDADGKDAGLLRRLFG